MKRVCGLDVRLTESAPTEDAQTASLKIKRSALLFFSVRFVLVAFKPLAAAEHFSQPSNRNCVFRLFTEYFLLLYLNYLVMN